MSSYGTGSLAEGDLDKIKSALASAVASGRHGEARLVEVLRDGPESIRSLVVAALGEASGPAGVPVLRSTVMDTESSGDTRCASLIALAKREGSAASDVFAACLKDKDASVRRYAFHCLGCVGDDREWSTVLGRLRNLLQASPPSYPKLLQARSLSIQSEALKAIVYLARHSKNAELKNTVSSMVRSRWDRLYVAEQDWLETHWPDCSPALVGSGTDDLPDPQQVATWLREPLLLPLYG